MLLLFDPVYKYSARSIEALLKVEYDFLSLPSSSKKANVQAYYEGVSGFPSCIDCLNVNHSNYRTPL